MTKFFYLISLFLASNYLFCGTERVNAFYPTPELVNQIKEVDKLKKQNKGLINSIADMHNLSLTRKSAYLLQSALTGYNQNQKGNETSDIYHNTTPLKPALLNYAADPSCNQEILGKLIGDKVFDDTAHDTLSHRRQPQWFTKKLKKDSTLNKIWQNVNENTINDYPKFLASQSTAISRALIANQQQNTFEANPESINSRQVNSGRAARDAILALETANRYFPKNNVPIEHICNNNNRASYPPSRDRRNLSFDERTEIAIIKSAEEFNNAQIVQLHNDNLQRVQSYNPEQENFNRASQASINKDHEDRENRTLANDEKVEMIIESNASIQEERSLLRSTGFHQNIAGQAEKLSPNSVRKKRLTALGQ